MTTENGDIAILHWTAQAVFTQGKEGPVLFNSGIWKLVAGTGQFSDKAGVGSLSKWQPLNIGIL